MTQRPPARQRASYRHGHLREALIAAGVDLARAGGPEAVVLREATRRAGVAPNAAYRHFADRRDLLRQVCGRAMGMLADVMQAEAAAAPDRLEAIGAAYVRFAQDEPGLFLTAFASAGPLGGDAGPDCAGAGGLSPFEILGQALDERVASGSLPPERRPGAEYTAWAAVHGLAMLIVTGPLSTLGRDRLADLQHHLLTAVSRGL